VTIHPPQPWPDGHTSLSEISARQHGLVTRAQLRALGWSARRIDGALRSGWLVRVHPGVYAVGLVPLGPHGRTLAAVLACGPDAVLSHRSAAALWGLIAGGQARWDVLVPATTGGRRGPRDVHLRRARRLEAEHDVRRRDGIPVTSVERTLVDLAATYPRLLPKAVHEAEVHRLLDVRAVRAAVERSPGRRGMTALRAAVTPDGAEPDHGAFVAAFLALAETHGLPRPVVGAHIPAGDRLHEVDLLFVAERVIVELDGEGVHRTRRKFHSDRRRDAALAAAGYLTVRYTRPRVTGEQHTVAEELRRILATAGRRPR